MLQKSQIQRNDLVVMSLLHLLGLEIRGFGDPGIWRFGESVDSDGETNLYDLNRSDLSIRSSVLTSFWLLPFRSVSLLQGNGSNGSGSNITQIDIYLLFRGRM